MNDGAGAPVSFFPRIGKARCGCPMSRAVRDMGRYDAGSALFPYYLISFPPAFFRHTLRLNT